MHHFFLLVVFAAALASCTKQPEASFTFSPSALNEGEQVTFTNTSADAESYLWDFGDGTTSEEESPVKTFDRSGSYMVKLTAYSKKEKKEHVFQSVVNVAALPYTTTGTMNGTAFSFVEDVNNVTANVSQNKYIFACGTGTNYSMYEFYLASFSNYEGLYFRKGTLTWECADRPSNSTFTSFFTTGTYPYSTDAANGIEIHYWDANGEAWSTDYGDQTGSTFTITKSVGANSTFFYENKFEATFNCKLYNFSGTQMKTVTNGFVRGYFENY